MLGVATAAAGFRQNAIDLPFSDPSRPGTLSAQVLDGDITVQGYDGNVVVIEVAGDVASRDVPEQAQGLRRILGGPGFTFSEANNVVSITSGWEDEQDLVVRVPFATALRLEVVDGDVGISDVVGAIELNAVDGDVRLERIAGSVLANVVDGDIVAVLVDIPADSPTSFSSVDGDIDLTLPPDSNATLTLRSFSGEVFTDFEIDILTELISGANMPQPGTGRPPGPGPSMSRTVQGTINGGGRDIGLQTMEGNIYLRRGN
jgi:hypothetical protein